MFLFQEYLAHVRVAKGSTPNYDQFVARDQVHTWSVPSNEMDEKDGRVNEGKKVFVLVPQWKFIKNFLYQILHLTGLGSPPVVDTRRCHVIMWQRFHGNSVKADNGLWYYTKIDVIFLQDGHFSFAASFVELQNHFRNFVVLSVGCWSPKLFILAVLKSMKLRRSYGIFMLKIKYVILVSFY